MVPEDAGELSRSLIELEGTKPDTDDNVSVKRLFCKSLVCCCAEAKVPLRNFFQIPRLQPHVINTGIKVYGPQMNMVRL